MCSGVVVVVGVVFVMVQVQCTVVVGVFSVICAQQQGITTTTTTEIPQTGKKKAGSKGTDRGRGRCLCGGRRHGGGGGGDGRGGGLARPPPYHRRVRKPQDHRVHSHPVA